MGEYDNKCAILVTNQQLWEILEKKYLTKSIESRLQLKSKLYSFQMQRVCSINKHLNRYTKLLTDLVNVDVETSEEDKAVILLTLFLGKSMRALLFHCSMEENPLTTVRYLLLL